jgi:two-component system nitrate/nitrite response regulator NarL
VCLRSVEGKTAQNLAEAYMVQQSCVTVLVGKNELLVEGLRRILIGADFCVAATAPSIDAALTSVLAEDVRILLIFNVDVDQNAIGAQVKRFKERCPTAFILLLADSFQLSDDNVVAGFRSGANAYVMNPSCNTLIKSLELVMAGETILPPTTLSLLLRQYDELASRKTAFAGIEVGSGGSRSHPLKLVLREHDELAASEFEQSAVMHISSAPFLEPSNSHDPRLSAREQCILRYLIDGDSNKIIARKIDIAEATVKVHVKALIRKIRVNNRTQAAVWGMNQKSANKADQAAAALASRP